MFRTKTIEESILFEERDGDTLLVTYAPGNGTKYVLLFQKLTLSSLARREMSVGEDSWLVTLVNFTRENRPTSMVVRENGGFLAWYYVSEKFGLGMNDSVCLAEIIGEKLGRSYETSESLRTQEAGA